MASSYATIDQHTVDIISATTAEPDLLNRFQLAYEEHVSEYVEDGGELYLRIVLINLLQSYFQLFDNAAIDNKFYATWM